MTLHPSEGTARKPEGALREPLLHQRDRTFWDSVRKPDDSIWNQASEEGWSMALLDESNLLAERARHAKFRTNHVGTKLNEAELHELGELVAKRKETPAELIRGLILRELKRDKEGMRPSVEMIEITAIRLQIVNLLKPVLTGIKVTPEVFDGVIKEVKNRKRGLALEILEEHEKA